MEAYIPESRFRHRYKKVNDCHDTQDSDDYNCLIPAPVENIVNPPVLPTKQVVVEQKHESVDILFHHLLNLLSPQYDPLPTNPCTDTIIRDFGKLNIKPSIFVDSSPPPTTTTTTTTTIPIDNQISFNQDENEDDDNDNDEDQNHDEDEPIWIFKLRQENAKILDEWNEKIRILSEAVNDMIQ